MKRAMVATGLAGAVLAAVLAGCGGKKEEHVDSRPVEAGVATGVTVGAVSAESVQTVRELAGSVHAATVSRVSARIMAQAVSVPVAEGDSVEKGRLLVRLDDRDLRAKVLQAEAGLQQAEAGLQQAEAGRRQAEAGLHQAEAQRELATATHERFRALLEGRAVSRQEYDQVAAQERMARGAVAQAEGAVAQAAGAVAQARSALAQASSAVEEARTWLAFTEVRAPGAGRVTARMIDEGSMAAPGAPLFTIEQEGRLRLELPVDSALFAAVGKGTPLGVTVEAAGFEGSVPVTEVVSAADPVSRTFLVKADLPPHPGLRSGQYARVTVGLGTREALTVPEAALVRRGQLDGVFVVGEGDRLAYRIVQAGRETSPGRREILSGLSAGERIAVGGVEGAVDGARVAGGR